MISTERLPPFSSTRDVNRHPTYSAPRWRIKVKITLAIAFVVTAAGLFAIPLTVLVEQESEKIADAIRLFNNECNKVSAKDEACREKHGAIEEGLTKFIDLAKQELDFLPKDDAEARAEEQKGQSGFSDSQKAEIVKQWGAEALDVEAQAKHMMGRTKDMQLQIRWARYYIRCLDRENAPECKAEKAALNKEDYPFRRVGLMTDKPTNEGAEEAKRWHPVKLDDGNLIEMKQPDAVGSSGHYIPNPNLPPDCVELSRDAKPRQGDYWTSSPPLHRPSNVPDNFVLTKVYRRSALIGWCYMDKSEVERLHISKKETR
jgi:hypothetical protein